MKTLFALLLMLAGAPALSQTELPPEVPRIRWRPNPLFSEEGFRLGYIMRLSQNILWNFEGRFMMGFGSSPQTLTDRDCEAQFQARINKQTNPQSIESMTRQMDNLCIIDTNPWLFSMIDPALYQQFSRTEMVPVVVYYSVPAFSVITAISNFSLRAFTTDTLNYVQGIYTVDRNSPAPTFYSLQTGELPIGRRINPSAGYVEGRVVKASLNHYIRKAYEITFQQGRFGNNFLRLSVNSTDMFDHLVMAMMTGEPVRIGYVRLFEVHGWVSSILFAYKTNYRVTSVEILRGSGSPMPPNMEPQPLDSDSP